MSQHDENLPLRHMLDHALIAARLARGRTRQELDTDEMLRLALTRAVEVIGEAATRVSQAQRSNASTIPWDQVIGTRHRLIHGYDRVDLDVLWAICTKDLPSLITELSSLLG